ncbi:hypothetical protein Taro_054813, partial [Colocasia esculenta]|nr:hypothetical protein [Colocasia esculenta]
MSFLMLLDSLHMGEPTRIENELKNFLKIAYEGKEMRAMADELKVIDLHVPNFLKTGVTLDRGDLFIRTRIKKAGGPVNEESAAMICNLNKRMKHVTNYGIWLAIWKSDHTHLRKHKVNMLMVYVAVGKHAYGLHSHRDVRNRN